MFSKLKDNYDTERQEIVAEYVVTNVRPGASHMLYQLSLPLEVYQGAVSLDGLSVRVNEWLQGYGKLEHRAHKIMEETLYLNNLPGVAVVRFNPGFTTSKFVQFPGVQGFALADGVEHLREIAAEFGVSYWDSDPFRELPYKDGKRLRESNYIVVRKPIYVNPSRVYWNDPHFLDGGFERKLRRGLMLERAVSFSLVSPVWGEFSYPFTLASKTWGPRGRIIQHSVTRPHEIEHVF